MTWAKDFYDDQFADLFLSMHKISDDEITFIKAHTKGRRILDQGCGVGRLSQSLSDNGFKVTGIDIVDSYITKATQAYPNIDFVCTNAETYTSDIKFDTVINWWTSFGHGNAKTNDINMLRSAFKILDDKGTYLIDIPNAEYCTSLYSNNQKTTFEKDIGGKKIIWDGWLSKDRDKIIKSWSYDTPDGQRHTKTGGGIWLYTPQEMQDMLKSVGFAEVAFYSDTKGSAYNPTSKRCIVVAQKDTQTYINTKSKLETDKADVRAAIYRGDIYKLNPTPITEALVLDIQAKLNEILGPKTQRLQDLGPHEASLAKLAPLKADLKHDPEYAVILKALIMQLGLPPSEYAIDHIRLRANIPAGHKNKNAIVAYAPHRDTWYCNPQSQINIWIPIFDCTASQNFAFYPDYFERAVKNNSKDFDYQTWISGGHATSLETLENPQFFNAKAGDILMFSGHHVHQTLPHDQDTVRYSLDFRIVHICDFEDGFGAPNVDNDSRPLAMADYMGSGI